MTPAPPKETKGKEPAPKAVDLFDFTEDDYAATSAGESVTLVDQKELSPFQPRVSGA